MAAALVPILHTRCPVCHKHTLDGVCFGTCRATAASLEKDCLAQPGEMAVEINAQALSETTTVVVLVRSQRPPCGACKAFAFHTQAALFKVLPNDDLVKVYDMTFRDKSVCLPEAVVDPRVAKCDDVKCGAYDGKVPYTVFVSTVTTSFQWDALQKQIKYESERVVMCTRKFTFISVTPITVHVAPAQPH